MSPFVPAALVAALYNPLKDVVLYVNGGRQDIKALEERIIELIVNLKSIGSAKEGIDRALKKSVFTEESEEYIATTADINAIKKKYIKFVEKYTRITNNQLSSSTELNVSTACLMIDQLSDLKSKVATFNFLKLSKLSRDIQKLINRSGKVLDRLRKPTNMIQKKAEPNQDRLDDGDNVLPVFNTYVHEVLEYLFNGGNEVGILGRKGVGKTTVLRKVYTRLLEQKSLINEGGGDGTRSSQLDNIILIDYPPAEAAEINEIEIVEKLQSEIMEQLEIHHEASKSVVKNANTISAFLRDRQYILLMDHVSAFVDLDKVGLRKGHKHKKLVICSRESNVISRMVAHKVKLCGLEKHDAWELFENICGKLYDSRKIAIADRIIEYCAGIPGMISVVANHLKDNTVDSSWNSVKEILQSKTKSLELHGLGGFDKVYEIKYEGLATVTKKCLLYGALFPHQYKIQTDYLIECWIAEGFIVEKVDQKVRFNKQQGQFILDCLTELDLMEWYSGKTHVMMPADFRRVALELDYPDEKKCVFWVPSKDRKPNTDDWTRVTRMSLIGCKVSLPTSPKCPNIYTLLLRSLKPSLDQLAVAFFFHMESLQVLDLNHSEIGVLPESIKKLVNLKSLYLKDCFRLIALPPEAAHLKKLEFLDICGTSIATLPEQIRCMVDMRCLRASLSPKRVLNHNSKGKQVEEFEFELMIPSDIISSLINIEEFCIDTAFNFQGGIDMAERLAEELASLELLNTLRFNFPNVNSLNTFVTQSMALNNVYTEWGEHTLRSFKIFIGCHETRRTNEPDFSGILAERWLRYSTNEEFSDSCQKLLKQASAFEVIGRDNLKSLTCSQFNLQSVKVCAVERCKHLENIFNGYDISEVQPFVKGSLLENLEKLYLYDLEKLQCIWKGTVPPTSLKNLTAITIHGCPLLTEILDPELALSLRSLEYLKVEDCCQVSKIIGGSSSISYELLERLKKIELSNLPKLESICESSSISWKSLNSIIVRRCSKLWNLSLTLTNARKLSLVLCEESWLNTVTPAEVRQRVLGVCCFREESIEVGEASTSGTSEITEDMTTIISINLDNGSHSLVEETPLVSDNLQATKLDDVQTDSSGPGLEDEDDDDVHMIIGSQKTFDNEILTAQLAPAT